MNRTIIAVSLLLAVWLSTGCNKNSEPPSTVAIQSRSESAATLKPVADRVVAPDEKGTAPPTPEQQAFCEALEKRATEIDRGYTVHLHSDGKMRADDFTDSDHVNEGVRIERRGWTDEGSDKDYTALKECLRNADSNLRQEKPLLTFRHLSGLRLGMTKEEIPASAFFVGWKIENCGQVDAANAAADYPTVSVCSYWFGGFNDPHDKSYLQARFDSDDRLVAWHYTEFLPTKSWDNSSDVIREERAEMSNLGIPDTEDAHSANWYFHSRSEMSKIGTQKVLELVNLTVSKQGNFWAITIRYSDVSKK